MAQNAIMRLISSRKLTKILIKNKNCVHFCRDMNNQLKRERGNAIESFRLLCELLNAKRECTWCTKLCRSAFRTCLDRVVFVMRSSGGGGGGVNIKVEEKLAKNGKKE